MTSIFIFILFLLACNFLFKKFTWWYLYYFKIQKQQQKTFKREFWNTKVRIHSVKLFRLFSIKDFHIPPRLVWVSGLSAGLRTKGSPVRFPVRAHAWVAGPVPSRGHTRGNHTLMFLPLSFYLLSPLSKNK